MNTVLLITNRRPDETVGRAEKIASRKRLFAERGWEVVLSYVPEPYSVKFPSAVVRALYRTWQTDPDVVLTMNNPFHMHLVGYIVKTATGTPWVAEFRDPILTHPDWSMDSPLRPLAEFVERVTVDTADRVCWLDGIQLPSEYFLTNYSDAPEERFVKLPYTGFDPAKFDGVDPVSFDSFTITYAGSFYEGWIEPYGFLKGLGRYRNDTDGPVDTAAHFFGDWNSTYEAAAAEANVADLVTSHGFVPHEEVIPHLVGSDALLYIGGTDPDNRLNIPSKIWDYVASRQPILALVDPDFAVAEFIEEHELGVVAHPDDPSAVAAAIRAIAEGEYTYDLEDEFVNQFSREVNADAFTEVLDNLVDASKDGPQPRT